MWERFLALLLRYLRGQEIAHEGRSRLHHSLIYNVYGWGSLFVIEVAAQGVTGLPE